MASKPSILFAFFVITLLPVAHSLQCYRCENIYKITECAPDTPVTCGSSSNRCVTAKLSYKSNQTERGEVETFYRTCTTMAECNIATAPCKDIKDAICEYKCCEDDLCNNSARFSSQVFHLLVFAFIGLLLPA